MTDQQIPAAPSQDRVTDEWLGAQLPGVFSRWHQQLRLQGRATIAAIIAAAGIEPGFRVVDVGCGSGIPTLDIAERVGPTGRVTAVDPSPVFIEAVTRNVEEAGLSNVEIVQASVTSMPFPPGSFDAATCHFGAMFFPDLPAGLAAIRRVLRPGGRAAFVAWGPVEDNRMFEPFFAARNRHLGPPPPMEGDPKDIPWPMRFAAPGTLAGALKAAGFEDVREEQPVVDFVWPGSAEAMREFWLAMANVGDDVPAQTRAAFARDLLDGLRPAEVDGELRFTARVVVASGRAPA